MKTFVYLSGLLLLLCSNKSFSQDPIFLNTNQSLIYLNPSFAGSNGLIRNQALYRNQWHNLSNNFVTYTNGFDAYIKPLNGGVAASVMVDDIAHGIFKTTSFNLTYAQHILLFSKTLKIIPSVQFGYTQKRLDAMSLRWGDMIDARMGYSWPASGPLPVPSKSYIDLSFGILINYRKDFYLGAYVFHFNQPDAGMFGALKLPYTLQFHSSYTFHINENNLLQVFSRFRRQGNYNMFQFSANAVLLKHLIAGAGYRNGDAMILNAGFRGDLFTFQVGYDVVVSKLSGSTAGAWEFGATFNLRNKESRRGPYNFESM